MELSELTRKAEAAKELKDPTARRIALRAIFAAFTDYRIGAIEERLGITHEGWKICSGAWGNSTRVSTSEQGRGRRAAPAARTKQEQAPR